MDIMVWGNEAWDFVKPMVFMLLTMAILSIAAGGVGFLFTERFIPQKVRGKPVSPMVKRLIATAASSGSVYALNRFDWIPGLTWSANSWLLIFIMGIVGSALAEYFHDNPGRIAKLFKRATPATTGATP